MGARGGGRLMSTVRLDKWLWAARFFKTRTAATAAVVGGKVEVNEATAKPSRLVGPGDVLRIRIAPYEWIVTVAALAERRGSVDAAAGLYVESEASRLARERRGEQLRDAPLLRFDEGRPGKRDRRTIRKLRGRD